MTSITTETPQPEISPISESDWTPNQLYFDGLEISVRTAESKPDLDGLRNNLERMQGSDTKPNPSILSKIYHVPEDVVRSEIKNYDFTDPLPRVVISIRFQDKEICSLSIPTEISLSYEDLERISEAAKEAYTRISVERTEEEA